MSNRCEDYPCCGHTDGLGCNWTYTPEAREYDMAHASDYELGFCDAYDEGEDECDPANGVCAYDNDDCENCADYWLDFHAEGMMEDRWLDGSYEE